MTLLLFVLGRVHCLGVHNVRLIFARQMFRAVVAGLVILHADNIAADQLSCIEEAVALLELPLLPTTARIDYPPLDANGRCGEKFDLARMKLQNRWSICLIEDWPRRGDESSVDLAPYLRKLHLASESRAVI